MNGELKAGYLAEQVLAASIVAQNSNGSVKALTAAGVPESMQRTAIEVGAQRANYAEEKNTVVALPSLIGGPGYST